MYSYVMNIIVRNNANPTFQTHTSLTIKIKLFSKQDALSYKQNVRSHKPGGGVSTEIKISQYMSVKHNRDAPIPQLVIFASFKLVL